MQQEFLDGRVIVKVADLTREDVDAIVNAANSSLMGGGGVDGAIHRAGGPSILAECKEVRAKRYPTGLPTGEAVITSAGSLPARYVIHTVGPVYGRNGGRDASLLKGCYLNCLGLAAENGLETIAFPAISTGIYGYPKDEAAAVSSSAIVEFLASNDRIREVRLVFHNQADADTFLAAHSFVI